MTAIYSSYMLMFVPSFIRIERGLDGGPLLHTKQDACFCLKISGYQCFAVCCPKTMFQQAAITAMQTSNTSMFVPSFVWIERVSNGGS